MSEEQLSTFIVEDELPARELMVDYVLSRPELRLDGMARDGQEAIEKLQQKREIDLLFLDIQLPDCNGIEILEQVSRVHHVVFTTAHDSHAIRAFEIGAVDYVLKPIAIERFNQAVDRVLELRDHRQFFRPSRLGLSIKEGENHYLLPYQEIVYLSSNRKHTILHTVRKDHESARLLKDFEESLPPELFQRIHKQHIVNLSFISHIQHLIGGRYEAFLKDEDETTLPVGRQFADSLKQKLNIG